MYEHLNKNGPLNPRHRGQDLEGDMAIHPPVERPLQGITVVELGNSVAAPFCGQILSELGARVIKVERPEGDDARRWGPPFWEGASSFFQAMNRNKESVVCDLRSSRDAERIAEFIRAHADVVIQNMRPGKVESLGLDANSLRRDNDALIYCNFGAFGHKGPMREKPGYDPLMQAFGGIMSTTGEPGRPAVRVGASIIDMGTGMWGLIGILAALYERRATGRGKTIDVSLFETATCWVSLLASQYLASGQLAGKQGSGAPSIVPYKAYQTRDGEIIVAAGSDELFRRLALAVGHPEWREDPRFADNPARVTHQATLYALLDDIFLAHGNAEWLALLEAAGIPCSPIQDLGQMLAHPQTEALGLVQPVPGTSMRFLGLPLSFDGRRPAPMAPPPRLGEHNDAIFKEA